MKHTSHYSITGWLAELPYVNSCLLSAWPSLLNYRMACPINPEDWKHIEKYRTGCNVPHALGAPDGKHIAKRSQRNLGVNITIIRPSFSGAAAPG